MSDPPRDPAARIVRAFEHAWQRGARPAIDPSLAGVEPGEARESLRVELVHVELEFRLKAGEPARVEEYLARYPQLRETPREVAALIAAEWTIRGRTEPGLTGDDYRARFPDEYEAATALKEQGSDGPRARSPLDHFRETMALAEPPEVALPTMFSRFELRERLGHGAFGLVYRAWDTRMRQIVAVKLPRMRAEASPREVETFLREARNAARVRGHPNIVPMYEAGEYRGTAYMVSEFIDGPTLAQALERGPIPYATTAEVMACVLEALEFAHQNQLIHRDLKPSNILLDARGRPRVTDFGLALRDGSESTIAVRREPSITGTIAYMSPEQARGETARVDGRSDVFSAGVVLYQLLTRELPFRGNERMILAQLDAPETFSPRRLNDTIPVALERICLKALERAPTARFQSALEMADALRRYLEDIPESVDRADRSGRWKSAWARTAARPVRALAMAYGVLAGGVGFPLAALGWWTAAHRLSALEGEAPLPARRASPPPAAAAPPVIEAANEEAWFDD